MTETHDFVFFTGKQMPPRTSRPTKRSKQLSLMSNMPCDVPADLVRVILLFVINSVQDWSSLRLVCRHFNAALGHPIMLSQCVVQLESPMLCNLGPLCKGVRHLQLTTLAQGSNINDRRDVQTDDRTDCQDLVSLRSLNSQRLRHVVHIVFFVALTAVLTRLGPFFLHQPQMPPRSRSTAGLAQLGFGFRARVRTFASIASVIERTWIVFQQHHRLGHRGQFTKPLAAGPERLQRAVGHHAQEFASTGATHRPEPHGLCRATQLVATCWFARPEKLKPVQLPHSRPGTVINFGVTVSARIAQLRQAREPQRDSQHSHPQLKLLHDRRPGCFGRKPAGAALGGL